MADNSNELNGPQPTAAELTTAILDEEAKRRAEQAERDALTVLPDDLLPGVGDEPMTLREIGKVVGLTRERVRQIERETLGKLYRVMDDE